MQATLDYKNTYVRHLPQEGERVMNTNRETVYTVQGISQHTENGEWVIVYKSAYGKIHHRPLNDFVGFRHDENKGTLVPRFIIIDEEFFTLKATEEISKIAAKQYVPDRHS